MKYKELKKQIQNINIAYDKDFKISNNGYSIDIRDDNWSYVSIAAKVPYSVSIGRSALEDLDENLRYDLLQAIFNFTQTPIDSRELERKFYISSKLTPNKLNRFLFKEFNNIDSLGWGYKDDGATEFTQEEIDYICDKFHTNLSDFNIDEVKE